MLELALERMPMPLPDAVVGSNTSAKDARDSVKDENAVSTH